MQKLCSAEKAPACREAVFENCAAGLHTHRRLCCARLGLYQVQVLVQCAGSPVDGAQHLILQRCHERELPPCPECNVAARQTEQPQRLRDKFAQCAPHLPRVC